MKHCKIIIFMFFIVCLSCQNQIELDPDIPILGKWKLIKSVGMGAKGDYSEYNIFFNYDSNGIMTISGVPENFEGLDNGECSYCYSLFEKDEKLRPSAISGLLAYNENCITNSYNMRFSISSKSKSKSIEMIYYFINPLIDGEVLNFIRIK